MKKYKNHTLSEYVSILGAKEPTPGGGSAAAMSGAMGAGLLRMVAQYSVGKSKSKTVDNKLKKIVKDAKVLSERFVELVDLDAQAYLGVVKARKKSAAERKKANRMAAKVPLEVCKLCYKGIAIAPYLIENGNKYLISDVEVASELLLAAYNSAMTLHNANA